MATDSDSGLNALLMYSIEDVSPPEHYQDFYVGYNGSIYTNNANLTATTYHLSVSVQDMGNHSLGSNTNVTIMILYPVPDSLEFTQPGGYTFSVNESAIYGTVLGRVQLEGVSAYIEQHSSFSMSHNNFSINTTTGVIQTMYVFDYEERRDYSFQVVARLLISSRHVDISRIITVTVLIIDVNDNAPMFVSFPFSLTWPENRTNEELIHQIVASDADSGINQMLVYSILNDDVLDVFRIDNQTGELYTAASLDREERESYSITIEVSDLGSPANSVQETIDFRLLDVNDNVPVLTTTFEIRVFERTEPRPLVNLTAVDQDVGNNSTVDFYKVQTTKNGTAQRVDLLSSTRIVNINPTGEVELLQELDYEDTQWYNIVILLRDHGSPSLESLHNVTLTVINVPDRIQFANSSYDFVVSEDEPRGSFIGKVEAIVIDDSNTTYEEHVVAYTISSQTSLSTFSVRSKTGEIYLIGDLDFDTDAHQHALVIQATCRVTSNIILSNNVFVMIDVLDVNDNPPQFVPSFYTKALQEFTSAGSSILTVFASDLDEEANIYYSLDGEDGYYFIIDSQTGLISARVNLSNAHDYHIDVVASDGQLTSSAAVYISVSRQASVNPSFTRQHYIFNISETSVHSMEQINIGQLEALIFGRRYSHEFPEIKFRITRQDLLSINNSIINRPEPDLFEINETSGVISATLGAEFDAEIRQKYVFYVEVYNSTDDRAFDRATAEVKIMDINDNSPIFDQSLYTRVISDSLSLGAPVLTVKASDRDSSTNAEIIYLLQPITSGFAINLTSGEVTVENTTLVTGTYYLNIVARDKDSPSQNESVSAYITIISTTSESVQFSQSVYSYEVSEDASDGYYIGEVEINNQNNASQNDLLFHFVSTSNDSCIILNPSSGRLYVTCHLDRESQARYELAVKAVIGEHIGFCKVVVEILDVNDHSPVFKYGAYAKVINNEHGTESPVVQVQATDLDKESVSYSLLFANGTNTSDSVAYFTIDEVNGQILLRHSPLPVGEYLLLLQASDSGNQTSTAPVWIYVTKARPPVVYFDSTPLSVRENGNSRSLVGHVTLIASGRVVNPEIYHNNLIFAITGGDTISDLRNLTSIVTTENGYLFEINAHSGAVHTRVSLDREVASSHIVTIRAAFLTYGISVEMPLNVIVTDDNDVTPHFQPSSYIGTANDSNEAGFVVATVKATDFDIGSNGQISFEIDSSIPFNINRTTFSYPYICGEIYVTNSSEFMLRTYNFSVLAIDEGSVPLTGTAQILIVINYELPDFISFTQDDYRFEIIENSPQGTIVGKVSLEQMTPAIDGLMYMLIQDGNQSSFVIDVKSGTLYTTIIDRETLPEANLTVIAVLPSESSLDQAETIVTVLVSDVNDNHPIFSQEDYMAVFLTTDSEVNTTDGLLLITVQATDLDEGSNAQIHYTIDEVTPEEYLNDFYITQDGSIYTTNTNLSAGTYYLNVSAEDLGTPSLASSTIVLLVAQYPLPESIHFTETEYSFYVSENSDPGTHIGYVFLEPIPSHAKPYINFSSEAVNFSILATIGEIQTSNVFDYESQQNFTFIVEAWLIINSRIPPVNISTHASVTVFISDVDDSPPIFLNIPLTLSWLENRTSEEHVYHILAEDEGIDNVENDSFIEFEILNTDILDKFRIDNVTGDLYVVAGLDREKNNSYTITVQVSDSASPRNSAQRSINFTLLDINDNVPIIFVESSNADEFTIDDSAEVGTVIANISVLDADVGNNGTVILETDSDTPFDIQIVGYDYSYTRAELFVANTSLLVPGQHTVNVTAMDRGEVPLQSTSQVVITVKYTLPDIISFSQNVYYFQIYENSDIGTVIGTVSIKQMTPALYGLQYSIQGISLRQFVAINSTSGVITTTQQLDRESLIHPQLNFTISAILPSEMSLQPAQTTVIVVVQDVNDHVPMFTQMLYSEVLLTTDISTSEPLIQVMATDSDSGLNALLTYSIENVSPPEHYQDFYIGYNGSIYTNNANLTATTYHLSVSAQDMGNHSLGSNTNVTIMILYPVPDSFEFTQPGGYTFSVNESAIYGTVVGRVQLEGVSAYIEQHTSFSMSHNNFSINSTNGIIQTIYVFDYEERREYSFQVVARLLISSRNVDISRTITVTVLIIDVNDNAPMFVSFPSSLTWPENRTNEELIHQTVTVASDADSGINQMLVYSILNDDVLDMFRIDNQTGDLYAVASLDREERESYLITIEVSDLGSPANSVRETIDFRLLDVNDNAPVLTTTFEIRVFERTEPRPLVNLTADDQDVGHNGTVNFYKIQTTKSGTTQRVDLLPSTRIVNISPIGEVELLQELDYEEAQWYNIVILLRDLGSPSLESLYNITLIVMDVPDNTPQFVYSAGQTVYQNSTIPTLHSGDTIIQVYVTDDDPFDEISYRIDSIRWQRNSSNPLPDISIDRRTGRIYSNAEQVILPESTFETRIIAQDNSEYNLSAVAVAYVSIVPLPLQFVETLYTVEISEATPVGTDVITVMLERLSISAQVRYSLDVTYPPSERGVFSFEHTDNIGETSITTARDIDRETVSNYSLVVTAGRGNETAQTTVVINITDVNDNCPAFIDPPNAIVHVSELIRPQMTIARINATDSDIGNNGLLQFQLDNITADTPFSIDSSTGDIVVTRPLDYETTSEYSLSVTVSDFGMPPRQTSNSYTVIVVNENDIPPIFSAPAYFGEIYALTPLNDYVRHTLIHVRDEDVNESDQDFTFHISFHSGSSQARLGYAFAVARSPPFYVQVIRSPSEPTFSEPQLLELQLSVTDDGDRGLTSAVPLYISIFTSDNLIPFELVGTTEEELLSCDQRESSVCGFSEALSNATQAVLNESVKYNNYSIQTSERNVNV